MTSLSAESVRPRARQAGLVVKELADETLVYDLVRHRAHCLNRSAALAFKHCDGDTSVARLGELFESELGLRNDARLVWLALEQLAKAELLETRLQAPAEWGRLSRRDAVRRLGVGLAALLPVVSSIVAPTPAEASASCVQSCTGMPFGTPCNDCTDDYCDGNGTCINV